jgi:hypothetical protein
MFILELVPLVSLKLTISAYSQPIATASGLLAIGAYSSSGLYPFTGAIRDFSLSYTN